MVLILMMDIAIGFGLLSVWLLSCSFRLENFSLWNEFTNISRKLALFPLDFNLMVFGCWAFNIKSQISQRFASIKIQYCYLYSYLQGLLCNDLLVGLEVSLHRVERAISRFDIYLRSRCGDIIAIQVHSLESLLSAQLPSLIRVSNRQLCLLHLVRRTGVLIILF